MTKSRQLGCAVKIPILGNGHVVLSHLAHRSSFQSSLNTSIFTSSSPSGTHRMGGRGGGLSRCMLVLVEVIAVIIPIGGDVRLGVMGISSGAGVGTGVVS